MVNNRGGERRLTERDLYAAIWKVPSARAALAGLLPILWSTGTGSAVMQRIDPVLMVAGMISSTILTLIVIPAIYHK